MRTQRPISIFVLIDALGWRFLEGREFLSDVLPHRTPLRTVLGFSSGAIPTILTGVPPAQNGHWNLFYYDPEGSPFRWLRYLQFLPNRVLDHRVMRKLFKEMGRHLLGMGPLFECHVSPRLMPYFNYVEKRNIYEANGISGARSIFDVMSDQQIPYRAYSYHEWSDQRILQQAAADIESGVADFFFVYLSEMDMFLHMNCKDENKVEAKLSWYAVELRRLLERAQKIDPNASLTIFSDHGMTPVEHHFDLLAEIEKLQLEMPTDYLAVYDSTMARYWFFSERARDRIVDCLNRISCGKILSDEELKQMGVFFPDRRYGEVVFLVNPGWLFARTDFNGRGWKPAGMHGYHPSDEHSDAIFLSNQKPSTPLRTIAEIYSVMIEAARNASR